MRETFVVDEEAEGLMAVTPTTTHCRGRGERGTAGTGATAGWGSGPLQSCEGSEGIGEPSCHPLPRRTPVLYSEVA